MYAQTFVDSMVAINIAVTLYLSLLLALRVWRARDDGPVKLPGTLLLGALFPLMVVISLSHASWVQGQWIENLLHWLELLFTIAAGPLVLALAYGSLTAAQLVRAVLLSAAVAALLGLAGVRQLIVFVPAAFTLTALVLGRRWPGGATAGIRTHVLVAAAAIHVAQVLRFVGRDIGWLDEVVPFTATVIGLIYLGWFLQSRQRGRLAGGKGEISPGIFAALDQHVRATEAFRNPELSVALLAEELQLPAYLVSQAINRHAGRFTDYINGYRVNAFLRDYSPHAKVEPAAYQAGFRSRSAFYRAFKAFTGKSPLQYFDLACPDS